MNVSPLSASARAITRPGTTDNDSLNSMLRAWKLSFVEIRGTYAEAAQLLSVMAFLDRQCMSRDLLQDLVESRHQLNAALGISKAFA